MGYEDQAFEKHLIATSSTISKYIEVNEQLFQPEGMDQHVDFGECWMVDCMGFDGDS